MDIAIITNKAQGVADKLRQQVDNARCGCFNNVEEFLHISRTSNKYFDRIIMSALAIQNEQTMNILSNYIFNESSNTSIVLIIPMSKKGDQVTQQKLNQFTGYFSNPQMYTPIYTEAFTAKLLKELASEQILYLRGRYYQLEDNVNYLNQARVYEVKQTNNEEEDLDNIDESKLTRAEKRELKKKRKMREKLRQKELLAQAKNKGKSGANNNMMQNGGNASEDYGDNYNNNAQMPMENGYAQQQNFMNNQVNSQYMPNNGMQNAGMQNVQSQMSQEPQVMEEADLALGAMGSNSVETGFLSEKDLMSDYGINNQAQMNHNYGGEQGIGYAPNAQYMQREDYYDQQEMLDQGYQNGQPVGGVQQEYYNQEQPIVGTQQGYYDQGQPFVKGQPFVEEQQMYYEEDYVMDNQGQQNYEGYMQQGQMYHQSDYENGKQQGYNSGYNEGYNAALANPYSGVNEYNYGLGQNSNPDDYTAGYEEGFRAGLHNGYEDGRAEVFQNQNMPQGQTGSNQYQEQVYNEQQVQTQDDYSEAHNEEESMFAIPEPTGYIDSSDQDAYWSENSGNVQPVVAVNEQDSQVEESVVKENTYTEVNSAVNEYNDNKIVFFVGDSANTKTLIDRYTDQLRNHGIEALIIDLDTNNHPILNSVNQAKFYGGGFAKGINGGRVYTEDDKHYLMWGFGSKVSQKDYRALDNTGIVNRYEKVVINCPMDVLHRLPNLINKSSVKFIYDGNVSSLIQLLVMLSDRDIMMSEDVHDIYSRASIVPMNAQASVEAENEIRELKENAVFDRVDWMELLQIA